MSNMPSSTPNKTLSAMHHGDSPVISCLRPDSDRPADNSPLHTIIEAAAFFGLSATQVKVAETTAFRKLRNNPDFIEIMLEMKELRGLHA